MNDTIKAIASDLDSTTSELETTAEAIRYIYNRLAEATETDIDKLNNEEKAITALFTYREAASLALILGEFYEKLGRLTAEQQQLTAKLYEQF